MRKLIGLIAAMVMLSGCLDFGTSLVIIAGDEIVMAIANDVQHKQGLTREPDVKKQDGY